MPDKTECGTVKRRRSHKTGGVILAVTALLMILMQIAYFVFNNRSHYEYIADWMLYAVNALILIAIFLSVFLFFSKQRLALMAAGIPLALLMAANIIFLCIFGFSTKSVITVSPDLHMMVLKEDPRTGEVTAYRNQLLIFARNYEQFARTADSPIKTQWLTPDVCAVTYEDTAGSLRQYIGTFGDRASGPFYYTVTQAIKGSWGMDAKNADDKKISADEKGITITADGRAEVYDYNDCVQFGTLAVVLSKNGIPNWTIALNKDCRVNSLRTLDDGCTITLCSVSMDKTTAFTYFRTFNPLAEAMAEMAKQPPVQTNTPQPTERKLSSFSELEKFASIPGIIEIETDSKDPFEIGRAAFKADIQRRAGNGYDSDLQISQMKLLAGDANEFLIEIHSGGTITKMGVTDTFEFSPVFRIKRGNVAYGAVCVSPTVDGAEGLIPVEPPQVIDTSGDTAYHVFVAGETILTDEQAAEAEQRELTAAQTLADMLSTDADLSHFSSQQGLVKVESDSSDTFMIARLALEENLKMFAVNGFDNDVQITNIKLLAGGINEFVVEVKYTSLISQGENHERAEYNPKYRIKKGDGVYIAMESGYDAVGPAGLNMLDPPQIKDTAGDPAYHFFVPASEG